MRDIPHIKQTKSKKNTAMVFGIFGFYENLIQILYPPRLIHDLDKELKNRRNRIVMRFLWVYTLNLL